MKTLFALLLALAGFYAHVSWAEAGGPAPLALHGPALVQVADAAVGPSRVSESPTAPAAEAGSARGRTEPRAGRPERLAPGRPDTTGPQRSLGPAVPPLHLPSFVLPDTPAVLCACVPNPARG